MKMVEKVARKMDEEGKVGWNKEGFEKLTYDEKFAVSVHNLVGQVYNGGFTQWFYNGYGFAFDFLFNEVAVKLDNPKLRKWLLNAKKLYSEYEKLGPMETAWGLEEEIDKLDEEFWREIADELEEQASQYLKGEIND